MINLRPNCVAQYKMNDNADNNVVLDAMGNYNGVFHGAGGVDDYTSAHSVAGKINRALRLERAQNNYIDLSNGPAIVGTVPFAVAFWVRLVTLGISQQLLHQRSSSSSLGSYGLWLAADNKIQFFVYRLGYGFNLLSDTPIVDNDWHLVLAQRINTADGELYLDNNLVDSGGGAFKILADVQVVIGRTNVGAGSNFLDGEMDVFRIWDDRFLVEAERDWIWNDGNGTERLNQITPSKSVERGVLSGVGRGIM